MYIYISLIKVRKRRDMHFIPDIIKNTLLNLFGYHSFARDQGARVNGYIIHIGDSVQYFGFNKQVLVQTKKEMHTVVTILYCRSQTILYVNTPSYLVLNINDDNLF